jgi:hypothetical protein
MGGADETNAGTWGLFYQPWLHVPNMEFWSPAQNP